MPGAFETPSLPHLRLRIAVGVVITAAVAAASYAYLRTSPLDTNKPPASVPGYRDVGTVDGVTFWVRIQGRRAAVRTTGRLGAMCDGAGPSGYTHELLCANSTVAGGISAGFVPDAAKTAHVGKKQFRIIRVPGPDNLAVDIVGFAETPPRGQLMAK